jgi:hypothetical protein
MSIYHYDTLNYRHQEIRTVILLPGLPSSPIHCTLETHDLNVTELQYEALSYEWGDSTSEGRSIFLNNREIQVRENLWSVLIHLRHHGSMWLLWIDALCIDRANPRERNHQVRMMGDIYRRARLVLIWLGLEGRIVQRCLPIYIGTYFQISKSWL